MADKPYSWVDEHLSKEAESFATKHAKETGKPDWLDSYNQPVAPVPPVEESKSTGNLATDIPKAVGRGIARLPDVVGSAIQTAGSGYAKMADVALGNENAGQGGAIENAVVSGIGKARDYTTRPIADYVDESLPYSQGTQEAQNELMADIAKIGADKDKNFAEKTLASLGAAATNPRGSLPSVAESIPQFVAGAAALKAAKVAEGLSGLGKASELTAKAETAANWGATKSASLLNEAKIAAAAGDTAKAAKLTALAEKKALEGSEKAANLTNLANRAKNVQDTAITGIGNAALEGEGAARGVRDDIMNMPVETLMQNPQFAQLASEVGEDEARRITSETAASNAYTPAAVLGATASALTGGGLEGALMRGFRDTTGKSIAKAAAVGGLKEMSEEGMQGASGQMAQNFAEQPYTGVDLMSGVAEQVGMGAGMGLFSGGAGSAAGAAYNKANQTKVKANELAEQAANTNGLSGAALTGQSAQLNADADAQLTEAQRLQDEVQPIDNIAPETQPVSPFKPLTQDIHAQVSNTLAFANEAIKNTKAGSDVKFKDKDATAIKTAADNLGIDLFNIDGTEKLPAQLVTEANTRLADYNVASIKPDVIDNAKNVINDIDFTTPLTPKESNSLRAVASDLGIQHDPVRPELTLPKIQKTIDLHTKLNAKPESTLSPTATNTGTNGRTESNVQPNADAGITDKEQPAPTRNTNTAKPTTPAWITRHLDSNAIKNPNNFGNLTFNNGRNDSEKLKEANDFIAKYSLTNHVPVRSDFGYEIHNKKFVEDNKQKQDSDIPDALKPSEEFADKDAIKNLVYNNLIKGENNNAYVNEKGVMVRHESRNPDWYKNGAFKLINPVTGKENEKAESVDRIYNAVDRYHKGEKLIGKDHAILQKLSDILTEEQRANSDVQEDIKSKDIKTAFERNSGKKITGATESDLNEMDKWAKEAVENEADNADEAQAVIDEINEYRANATNETTDTTQPETQRTGEDTANTANNDVQAKETVINDDTDKQANKAQDDQSANETQKATSEEVGETTARNSKPVEETTATEDNVLPTAKSSGNANTQSSQPAAKSEQNAVSPDVVEQDGWDKRLSLYIDANRSNDSSGRRTAKVAKAGVTGRDIQGNKQRIDLPIFSEQENIANLNFDKKKLKDAEHILENVADAALLRRQAMLDEIALTQELERLAETDDRIKIENNKNGSVKYTVFDDNGKKVSSFTRSPDKENLDAEAIIERDKLRQQLVEIGAGKFEVKNLTLHVQPLDVTSVNEMRELALAKAKTGTIQQKAKEAADAHKAVLFFDKVIHNLKAVLYALFKAINASTANRSMDNDNVREYKFRNADNTVMFTLQKGKSEFIYSDNNADIKGANAREKLKNIALRNRIKADIERIEKESAMRQMQGKIEAATSSANKAIVIDGTVQGMLGIDNELLQSLFQEQKANRFANNFKGFEAAQVSWQLPTVSGQSNPDLDIYQSAQAKKAQEARWINQQQSKPQETKLEPEYNAWQDTLNTKNALKQAYRDAASEQAKYKKSPEGKKAYSEQIKSQFLSLFGDKAWNVVSATKPMKNEDANSYLKRIKDDLADAGIKNGYEVASFARSFSEELFYGQQDNIDAERKATPANKPMAQSNSTANKSDADKPLSEMERKQEVLKEKLSKLGIGIQSVINKSGGGRSAIEEEPVNLLVLTADAMSAAIDVGYQSFKDSATFVVNALRSQFGDNVADHLDLRQLKGAYLFAKNGTSSEEEVFAFKSLDDLLSEPKAEDSNSPEFEGIKTNADYVKNNINRSIDNKAVEKYNPLEMTSKEFSESIDLRKELNPSLPNRMNAYIKGTKHYVTHKGFTENWWSEGNTEEDAKRIIHRDLIDSALYDGEKISDRVINEYPDLKSKYSLFGKSDSNSVEIDSVKSDAKPVKKPRKPRAKLPKTQVEYAENVLDESGVTGDLFAFAEDVIMPVTNSGMVSLETLHETPAEELTDSEAETYFDNLAADIIVQAEKEGIPDVDTEEETRIIEALAENVPAETIAEVRSEVRKPTHTINDDGEIVPVIRNGDAWETVDGETEYDDSFEATPIQSENTITLGDETLSLETMFERLKSKSESTKMRDLLKGHKDEAWIMAINKGVGTNANQKHAPILQALIDLGRYSKENPRGFSMDC